MRGTAAIVLLGLFRSLCRPNHLDVAEKVTLEELRRFESPLDEPPRQPCSEALRWMLTHAGV